MGTAADVEAEEATLETWDGGALCGGIDGRGLEAGEKLPGKGARYGLEGVCAGRDGVGNVTAVGSMRYVWVKLVRNLRL